MLWGTPHSKRYLKSNSTMSPQKKVLLTGASGFIAAHVLDTLLARGHAVVATVRSQQKADAILAKHAGKPLEVLVVPDMQAPGAFVAALKSDSALTAVVHTASPAFFAGPDQDPLLLVLQPAVDGTRQVFEAIAAVAPQVSSVVLTSSVAAMRAASHNADPEHVLTERDWNDVTWEAAATDRQVSYSGSKTFAERVAWEFAERPDAGFTLTTVNPPWVYGPAIHDVPSLAALNATSWRLLKTALDTPAGDTSDAYATAPPEPYIDVRDAALAHVLPLEDPPKFAGKRLLTIGGAYTPQDVLDVVRKHFPTQLAPHIAVGVPGAGARAPAGPKVDNSATNGLLGIKYRPFEDTVADAFTAYLALKEKLGK